MPTAKEQLQTALRENDPGTIDAALGRIREEKRAADEPAKSKGIPPPPPVYATIVPYRHPQTAADFSPAGTAG